MTSPAGFQTGQVLRCSRCGKDFTIAGTGAEENPDDFLPGGAPARSYRTSPFRYAILGVLVIVLGVLGYKLYEKSVKDRQIAAENQGGGNTTGPDPENDRPALTAADALAKTIAAMKERLAGNWDGKADGESHAVEYRPDGTFTYTVAAGGKTTKTVAGRWDITGTSIRFAGPGAKFITLHMEWTPEGKPTRNEDAMLRPNGTLAHPLFDRDPTGAEPTTTFTRKKT
jgi:hypothetical protein